MAELTNIRIQTLSKAVPTTAALAPSKVNVVGNTLVVEDRLGVQYVLGTLYADNIIVETPPMPQECGCSTTNAQVLATLIKGVDGVTPDMSDYYDKSVIDEKLGKKQDAISDLEEIRSGASKGATALQEHQPLKTINGEPIVGEGNIEIEGGIADLEGYATEEYVNNAIANAITNAINASY